MRTFIAADFPAEIIDKVERVTAYFKEQLPDDALKWVSTDKMHLTIKFIGEIPKNKITQVKEIMTHTLKDQASFNIGVQNLGTYPNIKNPRVIWLGIIQGAPLVKIHNSLDLALESIDVKKDFRQYSPHITLARVRRDADRDIVKEISHTLSQFKVDLLGTITIDEITLYKSKLSSEGPEYTPLHVVSLNKV